MLGCDGRNVLSLGERERCLLLHSFTPADVTLFPFLRAFLLHSLQEKAAWKSCFFTTPLAGSAVCPTGGLTVWTAPLFGYSSFLGQSFKPGVTGDPRG